MMRSSTSLRIVVMARPPCGAPCKKARPMMWSGFLLNATQHTQHYEEFKHKNRKEAYSFPKTAKKTLTLRNEWGQESVVSDTRLARQRSPRNGPWGSLCQQNSEPNAPISPTVLGVR